MLLFLAALSFGAVILSAGFLVELGMLVIAGIIIMSGSIVLGIQKSVSNAIPIEELAASKAKKISNSKLPIPAVFQIDGATGSTIGILSIAGILMGAGFIMEQGLVIIISIFNMAASIVRGLVKAANS